MRCWCLGREKEPLQGQVIGSVVGITLALICGDTFLLLSSAALCVSLRAVSQET
jgi:hypothetical protein